MATLTVPALETVASDATRLTIFATTDVEEESTEAEDTVELQEYSVFFNVAWTGVSSPFVYTMFAILVM